MAKQHPLSAYRKRHTPPLTLLELAAQIGVSKPTLWRWEQGIRNPDASRLATIARITGIPARLIRPDLARLIES